MELRTTHSFPPKFVILKFYFPVFLNVFHKQACPPFILLCVVEECYSFLEPVWWDLCEPWEFELGIRVTVYSFDPSFFFLLFSLHMLRNLVGHTMWLAKLEAVSLQTSWWNPITEFFRVEKKKEKRKKLVVVETINESHQPSQERT